MKCLHCGTEFEATRPDRKYCSHKCAAKASYARRHPQGEPKKRKCEQCGLEFEPKSPNQKYCSRQCQIKARSAKRKVEHEQVKCAVCGRLFRKTNGMQKYCTRSCAKKASRARNLEYLKRYVAQGEPFALIWKPARRTCLKCGREFVEHFRGDKFCSDDCCWEYYRPEVKAAIIEVIGDKAKWRHLPKNKSGD